MLIKMARRNLWRRKRRTLITAFTIAFGVFLSVTFTASGDYSYTNMINVSATMGYGHVTIEPAGYNMTPSLNKRIDGVTAIRRKTLSLPEIKQATVRVTGQAMFASAVKSVGGMFIGVDPKQEKPETNLFIRSIVKGAMFEGTNGRGVVIGTKMAEKLNLRIGKKLVYTLTDVNGEIVSQIARVVGIFKTGVAEVDGSMALLPIDKIRSTLLYTKDEATMVTIIIDDQRKADEVKELVQKSIGGAGLDVLTWKETQADMAGLIAIDRSMNYLFQFLVGLMIAAGILNTIMMAALERKHEFGVMMAIGLSPWKLFALMVTESFWLGLLGLVLGVIITAPWFYYMSNFGINLSGLMEEGTDIGGVLLDPVMKFRLYKESSIAILSGVFGLSILSGLYPAWKAGRVPPVESLKTI